MRIPLIFILCLAFLDLPRLSRACRCLVPPTLNNTFYGETGNVVFLGWVVEELPSDRSRNYLTQVSRVFKGCSFDDGDYVVVETGRHSCGLYVSERARFLFSGHPTQTQIATENSYEIVATVSTHLCSYNLPWSSVSSREERELYHYEQVENTCVSSSRESRRNGG